MSLVIEAFFDPVTEGTIRSMWQTIERAALPAKLPSSGSRLHISLASCDYLERGVFVPLLEHITAATSCFSIRFAHFGRFIAGEGALFLAPVVSEQLISLHRSVLAAFERYKLAASSYDLPDQWVPHCTLVRAISSDDVGAAIAVCHSVGIPLQGQIEALGLVAVCPERIEQLVTIPLHG
ncbi:MAG TPA: 2'-5' RNA ligase family protein [Roseiflexaceae bacterium]|nr:2'-5' RNA ligase family protein [Roseiflexaceae bacterium]